MWPASACAWGTAGLRSHSFAAPCQGPPCHSLDTQSWQTWPRICAHGSVCLMQCCGPSLPWASICPRQCWQRPWRRLLTWSCRSCRRSLAPSFTPVLVEGLARGLQLDALWHRSGLWWWWSVVGQEPARSQ